MKKSTIRIIVIVVIVLAGAWHWKDWKKANMADNIPDDTGMIAGEQNNNDQNEGPPAAEAVMDAQGVIIKDDEKIYTDEDYSFSFQFPAELVLKVDRSIDTGGNLEGKIMTIVSPSAPDKILWSLAVFPDQGDSLAHTSESMIDYLKNQGVETTHEDITIDGIAATLITPTSRVMGDAPAQEVPEGDGTIVLYTLNSMIYLYNNSYAKDFEGFQKFYESFKQTK